MKQIILNLNEDNQKIVIEEDTEILGLVVLHDETQLHTLLDIVHQQPFLKSLSFIKAVVYDKARFDLEAKLIIEKGAKLTDAYLKIEVLLMGTNATARAVPSLEITEDDVKGGHGATIGQLDKEQIFYLQSRGLNKKEAEKVLIEGFCADLFNKIHDEEKRIKLEQLITSR